MPQILYKNKWHSVKDVEKCDDGFTYQVDGIDGKIYHRDVKDMKLSKEETYEITNPDGSITRGPGKEPLRKPLKKSLIERWKLLKAKIDHEKAFMDVVDDDEDQDQPQDQEQPQGQEQPQPSIGDPDAQDQSDAIPQDQLRGDSARGGGDSDGDNADQTEDQGGGAGADDQPYDEAELIDHLRQDGYSDSEIAYVTHGHVPGAQRPEAKAADLEQSREKEKHDHKMDRMKTETEIQSDHAKRMSDLEYEHAKNEKALRLKHLEEELKTKLEHLKNKGKE